MPFRILLIEDNPGDARLLELKLHATPDHDFLLEKTDRLSSGLERLKEGNFDAVLLDMGLPDSDGIDTVRRVLGEFPNVPAIVLTGREDDDLAAQSVREGAQDYLAKNDLSRSTLIRALRHAIERNSTKQKLRESEELFKLITEHAGDMIAVLDPQGNRLYASPSYRRILGYNPEELAGASVLELIHPDDRSLFRESLARATAGNAGARWEYRVRHADGSWRFIEAIEAAIRDENGQVAKLVIVARDITERRALEAQFMQSQKMEAIGRLTGGIAHDFNNLLCVIIGYAEFLQEQLESGHPLRSSAGEILDAGNRAASLTRQLLAFSRQQVLDPRVLDLNSIIRGFDKLLRRVIGEDIQLETILDPQVGQVKADRSQLEQVLMNLAVNARDAMPQGGKLTIRTGNTQMDGDTTNLRQPVKRGPYVCLTVTDSGVGMDTDTKERAFDPFFTTKEVGKGTGLGLSTVYGVVKQRGGYVEIDSAPGKGATFNIYLPRIDAVAESGSANPDSDLVAAPVGTILIAEDEQSVRNLIRNTLQPDGYTLLEAKDGEEAIKVSREHAGAIDLLLTDIVMPGIGGRSLAREISRQRPDIAILYMSGYAGNTGKGEPAFDPGAIVLTKPFTRIDLRKRVSEALDSRMVSETSKG
jgi:PAS domain S-box-containing protein